MTVPCYVKLNNPADPSLVGKTAIVVRRYDWVDNDDQLDLVFTNPVRVMQVLASQVEVVAELEQSKLFEITASLHRRLADLEEVIAKLVEVRGQMPPA